jgi:hypothetical protein
VLVPTMASRIERRLLVNYRVDPERLEAVLPQPFRPRLVAGHAVAGICLIRLGELRPAGLPGRGGLRTENAAHRIAVEWDGPDGLRTGVYIPRRDTGARLTALVGGRLFPGRHHLAAFSVEEQEHTLRVAYTAHDDAAHVDVAVTVADRWPGSTLFGSLDEASAFFREGAAGYSPGRDPQALDGLELRTETWRIEPAIVNAATSSFFDDPRLFPGGTAVLDNALVMRDVRAGWRSLPRLWTRQAGREVA